MKILKISIQVVLMLMIVAWLVVAPAGKVSAYTPPQGVPATVTYNLYATDGYICHGGRHHCLHLRICRRRQGVPLTFQNSMISPPGGTKGFVPGAGG